MEYDLSMINRIIKRSIIFAIGTAVFCLTLAYFLLFTTLGSSLVIKWVILNLSKAKSVQFQKARGSIRDKIALENICVKGLQGFPTDSMVIIRQINIRLSKFSKEGLHIDISGGSLISSESEPVHFSGTLKRNFLDFSIHCALINFQQLSCLFPMIKIPQAISGNLKNIELKVSGPLEEQMVSGAFAADTILYENYIIRKGLFRIAASARLLKELSSMKGLITVKNMEVRLRGIHDIETNIQKANIEFNARDINSIAVKVLQGRLTSPAFEPILFYGDYKGGLFDFNIYSRRIGIDSIISLLNWQKSLTAVKGSFVDVDFYLQGSVREPLLRGIAFVEKLNHGTFSLRDAPLVCDVTFDNNAKDIEVNGAIIIKKGTLSGPGTAVVQLDESKLIFSGNPQKPSFDIKGESFVEKTKIKISLKGTAEKPNLKLSSEPPLPQEWLFVMLATGKKWAGIDTVFSKGEISPDLAMDFIDYFVLGGSGSKIADKFGITGLSVTLDKTTRGVELKKSVYDKVEVGYGVLHEQNTAKSSEVAQKISGNYKLTETIAVSTEKELEPVKIPEKYPSEQKANDKVMIKFKKNF